ncbi:MAG: DNA glycosylase AlkZ-like family protein, partial [Eubacteriales bacterium]
MTEDELKVRQLTNQYLVLPGEKLTVLRDLNGFQAQFMGNALHSMKIRCSDYTPETAAWGLVKNWTIRGTVHVFTESDLALFKHCSNGSDYRSEQWRGYDHPVTGEAMLTPERQYAFSRVILTALAEETKTREELKRVCREHGMTPTEEACMFDPWGGGIRDLCERGFLNYVVQEKKAYCLCPPFTPV